MDLYPLYQFCINFQVFWIVVLLVCVAALQYEMESGRCQRYITTCKEFTIVRQVGIHFCLRVAKSMVLITLTRNFMSIQRMFSHN